MVEHYPQDIEPSGRDLRAYTDDLRSKHPLVRNVLDEWVLLHHADVVRAAMDTQTFSSAVSRYVQIPNGLDGARHTAVRAVLDTFLSKEAIAPFVNNFAQIAKDIVARLPAKVEAVADIGTRFAVRAQSAWLGWPESLEPVLVQWVAHNHDAARSGNQRQLAAVASEFDSIIIRLLNERRDASVSGDLTSRLLQVEIDGERLSDEEVVSVLRNWTGGDLGSIALCIGVLVYALANDAGLQDMLRAEQRDECFDGMMDEILRSDDPFTSNRRITSCPVHIAGVDIPAGAKVKLHWTSANRDERVFSRPDQLNPHQNSGQNLVYGVGPHACPGRLLATTELRIIIRALLQDTTSVTLDPKQLPVREVTPVGGWARVPVCLYRE
ncbi:MAG: cytochrome P450 [Parahaliea sp.]